MTQGVDRSASFALLDHLKRTAPTELERMAPLRPDLQEKLTTYLNEVPIALELLAPLLGAGERRRVLEVGSGVGAVTACLVAEGHEIVAIEPAGPGFEDMRILHQAIGAAVSGLGPESSAVGVVDPLPMGVDDLDPAMHDYFDVVFSANVLEHVPDPVSALERMQFVLAPGGAATRVSELRVPLRATLLHAPGPVRAVRDEMAAAGPDHGDEPVGVAQLRHRSTGPPVGTTGGSR